MSPSHLRARVSRSRFSRPFGSSSISAAIWPHINIILAEINTNKASRYNWRVRDTVRTFSVWIRLKVVRVSMILRKTFNWFLIASKVTSSPSPMDLRPLNDQTTIHLESRIQLIV